MVHVSREYPDWAPLLATRSLSQPACSEAVVVIFALTYSDIWTNLDRDCRFRAKIFVASQSCLFSRHDNKLSIIVSFAAHLYLCKILRLSMRAYA